MLIEMESGLSASTTLPKYLNCNNDNCNGSEDDGSCPFGPREGSISLLPCDDAQQ